MNRGRGPTEIVSVTALVFASTRVTTLFSGLLTQIAPSAKTGATDPGATAISADTVFVAGSIRESVPLMSVHIQTASGDTAIPPSLLATPTGIVATSSLVLISTRASAGLTPFSTFGRSPQSGTQTLPNPAASPEQGRLPTSMAIE